MDLVATNQLQAFQEFWSVAKSWLENQGVNKQDQYHKMVCLLGPKGIEILKVFHMARQYKEDPAKVLDKFRSSFQASQHKMELQGRSL